jgi:hypothetical protein
MEIGTKLICIKDRNATPQAPAFVKGGVYCINNIIDKEFTKHIYNVCGDWFSYDGYIDPNITTSYYLYDYFITLAYFREQRLNNILENL